MRLTKLTLSGFKSFADTTELTFDKPITGVVGPNGCGKSNIVDAIKWVLGERSSKSLRGTEMLDVIFAGSANRKPSGMASVTLSFDNPPLQTPVEVVPKAAAAEGENEEAEAEADSIAFVRGTRGLPIDADTVEVERRLYRDGTSQYLINGRRARLRDIRELFLDTGIGADAYSIIEQGKVDAMLLANPQERRAIFEEAAGIAKYKQRRVESQRKLEKTQLNLRDVRQELDSTQRRLRLIRGQADKARTFRRLDEQLAAWRTALAFAQYDALRQRLDGLTSRQHDLEGQRATATAQVGAVEDERRGAEAHRAELAAQARTLEHERLRAEQEQARAAQAVKSGEQAKALAEQLLGEQRRQLEAAQEKLETLEISRTEQQARAASLSQQLDQAQAAFEESTNERARAAAHLQEHTAAIDQERSALHGIDRERSALRATLESDRHRLASLEERWASLDELARGHGSQREQLTTQLAQLRASLQTETTELETLQQRLNTADASLQGLGQDRSRRAAELRDLEHEHARLESRRATLQEMDDAGAGYDEAAREVLEARRRGEFAGVLAPLAETIETDAANAATLEVALGSWLQAMIVPSLSAVPDAESLASIRGRVAWLSLHNPMGTGAIPAAFPEPPRAGEETPAAIRLRPLVRPRLNDLDPELAAPLSSLLDRLLGDVYVTQDLAAAVRLAHEPSLLGPAAPTRPRFVTRDGVVVEPDGRVITGQAAAQASAGLLQRRHELAALHARLAELDAALASCRRHLSSLDEETAALAAQASTLRGELSQRQRRLMGEQAKTDRLSAELERVERQQVQNAQDLNLLREQHAQLAAAAAQRREKLESLERLLAEHQDRLAQGHAQTVHLQSQAEAAAERVSSARLAVGTLAQQFSFAKDETQRLERSRHELAEQAVRAQEAATGHEHRIESARSEIARATGEIEQARVLVESLAAKTMEMTTRLSEADQTLLALADRLAAARQHALNLERDWNSLEISRRELEVKRENLEERATQELRLDLAVNYSDYAQAITVDEHIRVIPVDLDVAAATIDQLAGQIRALGHVNPDAIDEEGQLGDRHRLLETQLADLDAAQKQLVDLIERLNIVSRERFESALAAIREHFAGQDGMFRKLFGGGKAEIKLLGLVQEVDGQKVVTDTIDPLESGIEIIAKPPGKEPRSISQLSGGEKTLTAVALLMAIFRSKPSCFCVLDEVDAALDESNVERYCLAVKGFTDRSHFIIITHNKKTMRYADELYGITMQQRGVSTRVRANFEKAAALVEKPARGHGPVAAQLAQMREEKAAEGGAAATSDAQMVAAPIS